MPLTRSDLTRTVRATLAAMVCLVTPALIAWLGILALAAHEQSMQPDGSGLEAGGRFALNVLLLLVTGLNYLGSLLVGVAVVAWLDEGGAWWFRVPSAVAVTSGVITFVVVALNWTTSG